MTKICGTTRYMRRTKVVLLLCRLYFGGVFEEYLILKELSDVLQRDLSAIDCSLILLSSAVGFHY